MLVIALLVSFCLPTPAFAKRRHHGSSSAGRKPHPATPPPYAPPARGFTTVVIDAGHGGHDNGGIPGQVIPEKIYTIDMALRLRPLLKRAGFNVVLTRTNDTFVSLPDRVRIANAQRNAVFVSIHFNSSVTFTGHGFETYYCQGSAGQLAARIQGNLVRAYPYTVNRGVKFRGYYVLRKTTIPSVLAECGFLTNPQEARLILDSSFRQRLAEAIAQAIIAQRGS